MRDLLLLALTAVASYLVGAVPFGYLVARSRGVNIFERGSGNIGATNVGRVLGRHFGIFVFVLDFLKGALPALAAAALSRATRPDLPPQTLPVTAGLVAFLGHLFPVYLRFRGGKGVATGAGVVAVLLPVPALAALLAWVVVVSAVRIVSLASLSAAAVLCLVRLLTPHPLAPENRVLTLFCLLTAALVLARHHGNVRRLLRGREPRLKDSPAMLSLSKVLHLLALGLWFGATIFFSFVVGFALFGTFEELALKEAERPLWFPLPDEYKGTPPSEKFPDPLRKEQGSRAAGYAISPLFTWFYVIQAACAVVTLVTAAGWSRAQFPQKVHKVRTVIVLAALVTVAVGWWLEWEVSELRVARNNETDVVLRSDNPTPEQVQEAEQARSTFGAWHGISLLVNLVTVALVTAAMALAAWLPAGSAREIGEQATKPVKA